MSRTRVLFYSHDSFGLGHFRRSLTIASYLVRHIEGLSALMVTGLDAPGAFESPPGIDFVKLPSIWKTGIDSYRSRHLRVSFARVRRLRRTLIRGVTRAFDPNLVVVDNVPRGAKGEMLPTLQYLHEHRPQVKVALTLRDVLDRPERIVSKWRSQGVYDVLRTFYSEIWVAGARAVFDPTQLYEFPHDLLRRVRFCGYVTRFGSGGDSEALRRELHLDGRPLLVASCGGGGDGFALIDSFIDAALPLLRDGAQAAVFLGPDMPAGERRALKQRMLAASDNFLAFDFRPDLVSFLRMADVAVSMAGYNTMCELLSQGTPAVVVPRTAPRQEQLLRAETFAGFSALRVVRPNELSAQRLQHELLALLRQPREARFKLPEGVDFSGLARITRRVRKLLGRNPGQ